MDLLILLSFISLLASPALGAVQNDLKTFTSSALNITTDNADYILVGSAVFGGLLILTVFLYGLDVYVTSQTDQLLQKYYGQEGYESLTSNYDPNFQFEVLESGGDNFRLPKNYFSATTAKQWFKNRVKRQLFDLTTNEINIDTVEEEVKPSLDPGSQAFNDGIEVRLFIVLDKKRPLRNFLNL